MLMRARCVVGLMAVLGLAGCPASPGSTAGSTAAAGELRVGDPAPAFDVVDQSGGRVRLADLKGQAVVLYSYPKDDTPGCTVEARAFSAAQARMQALGAVVLGVSAQDAASHVAFRERHGITFPLLVDPDAALMKAYGMWNGTLARRMTFLIGPDGVVRNIWRTVNVQGHDEEVLAAVQALMQKAPP